MRRAMTSLLWVVLALGTSAASRTGTLPASVEQHAPTATASLDRPIRIEDEETIVFYGDSITEQNLYSSYLETFLLSRFPGKKIAVFNFGWSGDTASGGLERFARDVAPVDPSLVFVNFGMNDGGYTAFDEATYRSYIDAQRALAETIAAAGAREVLFTASPMDDVLRADGGVYNDTLSRMARGVVSLGDQRQLPVIDLFHPMADVQRRAKARDPGFTMIPDAIHPDAVGHLVMAYLAMRRIDAPRTIGDIEVDGDAVTARGVTVRNAVASDGLLEFDVTLPFLPFYVPTDARRALDLVPLQEEVNRFRMRGRLPNGEQRRLLVVDGRIAGVFTVEDLAAGVDLALLDAAPWSEAGRTLWEVAQFRWQKHFEAWRRMGVERPAWMVPALPSFEPYVRAQRAYADDLGRSLGAFAQPGTYHVALATAGNRVPIRTLELSPTYPLDRFETAYPPERDPAGVPWTSVPVSDGQVDLAAHFTGAANVVSYARLVLEAHRTASLHLALGSDDGLAVFLDGERVLARDVMRALRPGEDQLELRLPAGRHEILFKVTQGGGGYALAIDAQVLGTTTVRQVAAH